MPVLVLMRHAHAEAAGFGIKDFDRPLSALGREDARTMAKQFSYTGVEVSKVFCSPARRTVETLICVRETIKIASDAVFYPSELYSGDVSAYHQLLTRFEPNEVCMIIGHNPMIEYFAFAFVQSSDTKSLAEIKQGFPTAAIAVISLDHSFSPATPQGKLLHFFSAN
jgi:phosphohistidine phosphatase